MSFPVRQAATRYAMGSRHVTGRMNKLEASYASDVLEKSQWAGEVLWFKYEAVKLRLAEATFYTPDFFVMKADLSLEVHETKGFWEDDARVKIKVAAAQFPFKFIGVKKEKGVWIYENF